MTEPKSNYPKCINCGIQLPHNARYCYNCGAFQCESCG